MSKNKPDSPDNALDSEPALLVGPVRVFRDKLYTSRTLVFPDGSTAPVIKARVAACGDEQYEFLKARPDMEQVQE